MRGMDGGRGERRQQRMDAGNPYPSSGSSGGGNKRVLVGNLPLDASWQDLKDFCRNFGNVIRTDMQIDLNGHPNGVALVEFSTAAEAEQLILDIRRRDFLGRILTAKEFRDGRTPEFAAPPAADNQSMGGPRVLVYNLSFDTKWPHLKDFFRRVGHVVYANIMEDANGKSKGYGVVEFETLQEVDRALRDFDDTEFMGRRITVREDRENATRGFHAPIPVAVPRYAEYDHYPAPLPIDRHALPRYGRYDDPPIRRDGGGLVVERQPMYAPIQQPPAYRSSEYAYPPSLASRPPAPRLVVSNLNFETKWQHLKDLFRCIANVTYANIPEDADGRSKGYGILEFGSHDDVVRAIQEYNGKEFMGRRLLITEEVDDFLAGLPPVLPATGGLARHGLEDVARLPPPTAAPVFDAGLPPGHCLTPKLHIGNLHYEVKWQHLKDHFRKIGPVVRTEVSEDSMGKSRGYGYVEYATVHDAEKAIAEFHESEFMGRRLFVREFREPNEHAQYVLMMKEQHLHQQQQEYALMQQQQQQHHQPYHHDPPPHHYSRDSGYEPVVSRREHRGEPRDPRYGIVRDTFERRDIGIVDIAPDMAARRVYVENLAWDVKWQHLKDHFRQIGQVSYANIFEDMNGKSKGTGVVEFTNAEDAKRAIAELNNVEFMGRRAFVRENRVGANDRKSASYRGTVDNDGSRDRNGEADNKGEGDGGVASNGDGSVAVAVPHGPRLYVGNLSWEVKHQQLKEHFQQIGPVAFANVMEEQDGRSKGFGIVEFVNAIDTERAIDELNDSILLGARIFVREHHDEE